MAPSGRGLRRTGLPAHPKAGRLARTGERRPSVSSRPSRKPPGAVRITLGFRGGAQGSERPSDSAKVTQLC